MKIAILTIFPQLFSGFLSESIISKAQDKNQLTFDIINIRDFALPPHFQVDDSPYGGGAGMLMKPEPLSAAIESAKGKYPDAPVVLMSASGKRFTQDFAKNLSLNSEMILICGRYEGIDQRVIDELVDHEVSIGDYVLMGGEVAAMVVIEATVRLIADVVGNSESLLEESFTSADSDGLLLEAPQYTRPPEFKGKKVPEVLLSGDHKKILEWRLKESQQRRAKIRSDLLVEK